MGQYSQIGGTPQIMKNSNIFPFFLDESVPYLYVYLDDKTVLKIFVSICQLDLVFYKLNTENLYLDKSDN